MTIINVDGKYYALGDRCGHMNASLSRGKLSSSQGKNIVVCPFHGSTYDIVTGRNLTGPVKPPPVDMSTLPKAFVDSLARSAELMAFIKVHDLETFEVQRQGEDIKLNTAPRRLG